MNATLSLHSSRMAAEDIQELTAELLQSIKRDTDVSATLPEQAGRPEDKGDLSVLGEIVLAVLNPGTVIAFLQILQPYFNRHPSVTMKIKAANGNELELVATNFNADQSVQLIQAAKQFCAD